MADKKNIIDISLFSIFKLYKVKITITISLVVIKSIINLFFSLFMGNVINDLLVKNHNNLIVFALLGELSIIISSWRRFYDTTYTKIYAKLAPNMLMSEGNKSSFNLRKAARSSLFFEFCKRSNSKKSGKMNNINKRKRVCHTFK